MPKKMKRKALLGALTLKVKQGMVQGLQSYDMTEIKTKQAASVLRNFGIGEKKTLLVIPESNDVVVKSFRNIEGVSVTPVATLNAYDLLSHTNVVFRKAALEKLENPSFAS